MKRNLDRMMDVKKKQQDRARRLPPESPDEVEVEINPKDPRYLKVVWGVGYKIEKA